jgi:hypothetical protein
LRDYRVRLGYQDCKVTHSRTCALKDAVHARSFSTTLRLDALDPLPWFQSPGTRSSGFNATRHLPTEISQVFRRACKATILCLERLSHRHTDVPSTVLVIAQTCSVRIGIPLSHPLQPSIEHLRMPWSPQRRSMECTASAYPRSEPTYHICNAR